jgi:hypothetical protein
MLVELPLGDVVDKLSILLIKTARISDPARLLLVQEELRSLEATWAASGQPDYDRLAQWEELLVVNTQLWEVEDRLRECERQGDFGPQFVELARSVYITNDRRAELKRQINRTLGSRLEEVKSYSPYTGRPPALT